MSGMWPRPLALRVTEVQQTLEELRQKGVEVVSEPSEGFSFDGVTAVIRDPHGLLIELREWRAGDSPANDAWRATRPGAVRTA